MPVRSLLLLHSRLQGLQAIGVTRPVRSLLLPSVVPLGHVMLACVIAGSFVISATSTTIVITLQGLL